MKHNLSISVISYFVELYQKAFDQIVQISRKRSNIWCVLEGGLFYHDPNDRKVVDCWVCILQVKLVLVSHTIPVEFIPQSTIKPILQK